MGEGWALITFEPIPICFNITFNLLSADTEMSAVEIELFPVVTTSDPGADEIGELRFSQIFPDDLFDLPLTSDPDAPD